MNKAYKPTVKERLLRLENKVKKQDKQIKGIMLFNLAETTAKLAYETFGNKTPDFPHVHVSHYKQVLEKENTIAEKELEIELKKAEIDLLRAEIKQLRK